MNQPQENKIRLHSGNYFDYTDIENSVILFDDIAHGLSNTCRFSGQCSQFYSVAEHSVLVSLMVPPEIALQALLHDASEAVMCDIPKPLKVLLPEYVALEERVQAKINKTYGLPITPDPRIKEADKALLQIERQCFYEGKAGTFTYENRPLLIYGLNPPSAKNFFINRMIELRGNPINNSPKKTSNSFGVSQERIAKARRYFEQAIAGDKSRWGVLWNFQKDIKKGWPILGFTQDEIKRIKVNKPDWV